MNKVPPKAFVLALVLVMIPLFHPLRSYPDQLKPILQKGDHAPAFELNSPGGKAIHYEPGGKVSVLVFWSAFCPLCREMVPDLKSIFLEYGDTILFFSVNVDGDRFSDNVKFFIDEKKITFPVVYDRVENEFFVAADKYGVKKTPTIFFIGKDKRVIDTLEGEEGKKILEEAPAILSAYAR